MNGCAHVGGRVCMCVIETDMRCVYVYDLRRLIAREVSLRGGGRERG